MQSPLRLGIAGLGTVGQGVIEIVQNQAELLALRAGRRIEISAVSARSREKNREVSISEYVWENDPAAVARRDDVDVFLELIGGEAGPAKEAVEAALHAGKDVVTANKAMLAHHGVALASAAETRGQVLRFEAAVAGGIPIVKALTEGLASNKITRVLGVMNGTCNYILTRMETTGLPYEQIFEEARALGYLEADPNLDVGGIDAAHKLSLLSAIAFGARVDFDGVHCEGIGQITLEDITQANDLGFKIKLLGVSQRSDGGIEQRMTPCLVPNGSPLGQLEGGTNMVVVEGDPVGQIIMRGPGAGAGPTASAVMADVIDLARGMRISTFGQAANHLVSIPRVISHRAARFYVRLTLEDRPGTLARVTKVFGDAEISIDRMRQYGHASPHAPVLILTHATQTSSMADAIAQLKVTDGVACAPVALRIEDV